MKSKKSVNRNTYQVFERKCRHSLSEIKRYSQQLFGSWNISQQAKTSWYITNIQGKLKKNYRPVSVLNIISKLFEKLINKQFVEYVEQHLSPYLCGYRKGYSTQYALLSLIEKWKHFRDRNGYSAAILMDLLKAFDTINHDLLIAKLHSYGVGDKALRLFMDYLNKRWQHRKIKWDI